MGEFIDIEKVGFKKIEDLNEEEKKKLRDKLNYVDSDGNKLYGFSVADIQEYNKRLRDNTKAIYVIGFGFLLLILGIFIFLFWYVHNFNVLNNIVSACL